MRWIFRGKLSYVLQSSLLPSKTLRLIMSLTYQFIWGSHKEVVCLDSTYPCRESCLDLWRYEELQQASLIERVGRLWESDDVWATWIRRRYVDGKSLATIDKRHGDSSDWKKILSSSNNIEQCMTCLPNRTLRWNGRGDDLSLNNMWKTIRSR